MTQQIYFKGAAKEFIESLCEDHSLADVLYAASIVFSNKVKMLQGENLIVVEFDEETKEELLNKIKELEEKTELAFYSYEFE